MICVAEAEGSQDNTHLSFHSQRCVGWEVTQDSAGTSPQQESEGSLALTESLRVLPSQEKAWPVPADVPASSEC